MPSDDWFTMQAGYEERDVAFASWFKWRKNWGGRRDPTAETHAPIMDMRFVRSYEEFEYEGQNVSLRPQFYADGAVTERASLNLWCVGFNWREE